MHYSPVLFIGIMAMNGITCKTAVIEASSTLSSRRRFLKNVAVGSLAVLGASSGVVSATVHHVYARPSAVPHKPPTRPRQSIYKELALHNPNTGESLKCVYYEDGRFITDALEAFNHLLRDYHSNTSHPIDPALLDQLHELKKVLPSSKPFHIISGYRSPDTNAYLRRQSYGVAKNSLHMQGRAIDIRLEGVSSCLIRDAAVALSRGGVGYYPDANFVHLDTGDIRVW